MIVIGYQGIGKSTLTNKNIGRFIDLESSNFFINGKRATDWYLPYCNIAIDLSNQGFVVFTSSHAEVRETLFKRKDETDIITVTPVLDLEKPWVKKLRDRYDESHLEKDFKAYLNAKDRFSDNVKDIMESGFNCLLIKDMEYDLYQMIMAYTYASATTLFREAAHDNIASLYFINSKGKSDSSDILIPQKGIE